MKVFWAIIELLLDLLEGLIYCLAIAVVVTSFFNPFGIWSYMGLSFDWRVKYTEYYYGYWVWGIVSFCWWVWFISNGLYKAIKKRM